MTPISFAKQAILEALKARDIATVAIAYGAWDGTGSLDIVSIGDSKHRRVSLDLQVRLALYEGKQATTYPSLRQALREFALLLLDHYHGDFMEEAGSCGTITVDVPHNSALIEHTERLIVEVDITTTV